MSIQVGDRVYLLGYKMGSISQKTGKFVCSYYPEQLIEGKYVKHAHRNEAWTGVVERITSDNMVKVGGGFRGIEFYEKVK